MQSWPLVLASGCMFVDWIAEWNDLVKRHEDILNAKVIQLYMHIYVYVCVCVCVALFHIFHYGLL